MEKGNLRFKYDRKGDILYIGVCAPYPEQESDELGDDVVARFNPRTGEIEYLEILSFSKRFEGDWGEFSLPVSAYFRAMAVAGLD
jgi:uncharacterized protein YuzE